MQAVTHGDGLVGVVRQVFEAAAFLTKRGRVEHWLVQGQVVQRLRCAVARLVLRSGAVDHGREWQGPANQAGINHFTGATAQRVIAVNMSPF